MSGAGSGSEASTQAPAYTERLERLSGARWKRWLDVQAPYRWNLRRLRLGRTLEIGCGVGRCLAHLAGQAVGVDHNAGSVAVARRRGLEAFTPEEFLASPHAQPGGFDALLLSHVVEHMGETEALELVRRYLPFLRPGGKVALITPQERGHASDATHVRFVDLAGLERLAAALGLEVVRRASFPLTRAFGRLFTHNEFVLVARLPHRNRG
ncbi:MAG: class I SAM-dependent methyltransferase [Halobacteriales archaeon]|nr:class I SAM-dependent methyltransferase [Halobacteriales archaeon]